MLRVGRILMTQVGFAIWTADAFFENGKRDAVFENKIKVNPIGDVVAPAISLTLAAELYLKALAICVGVDPPTTHRLRDLLERLPTHIQAGLRSAFQEGLQSNPREGSKYRQHFLRIGPDLERLRKQASNDSNALPSSLDELLTAHETSFVNLRYLHELENWPNAQQTFDAHSMVVATEAFRQAATQAAEQRGFLVTLGTPSTLDSEPGTD
jgi:hypothetical protein